MRGINTHTRDEIAEGPVFPESIIGHHGKGETQSHACMPMRARGFSHPPRAPKPSPLQKTAREEIFILTLAICSIK
jgi:hypothetical protein